MIYKLIILTLFSGCLNEFETNKTPAIAAASAINNNRGIIYHSINYGNSWTPVGEGLPQDIQIEYLEKKGDKILLGSENYGLYISDRLQTKWYRSGRYILPGDKIVGIHVSGEEIYAAVFEKGIFRSDDDGATWFSLNKNLPDKYVRSILKLNGELFVGTDSGIFRSKNGGTNWGITFTGAQVTSLKQEAGKMVAGTHKGVLLSEDSGKNWTWINTEGTPYKMEIFNGKIVALLMMSGIRVSEDWGKTWKKIEIGTLGKNNNVYEIVQAGKYWVCSHDDGIYQSSDEGITWDLVCPASEEIFLDLLAANNTIFGGTVKR